MVRRRELFKKATAGLLCVIMVVIMCSCNQSGLRSYKGIEGLDEDKPLTLTIAIPNETDKALNSIANEFMLKYPNVTVQLQYVEDYENNALEMFKRGDFDMMIKHGVDYVEYTKKNENDEDVPDGTTTDDYFYDFKKDTFIDFSNTTNDLSDNYTKTRTDANGETIPYQYCYPLGGDTRGVFVNKTLLDNYGLKTPTNYSEFLSCCEELKKQGLIPIQGNAGTIHLGLGIAPGVNPVVHDEAALDIMRHANEGVSELFSDTISKLYELTTLRYIDYKAVEESGYFASSIESIQTENFLGLVRDENTMELRKPENNYGYAAFFPYISSAQAMMDTLISEYDLDTEIEFIGSPLNDDGKSPIYITPCYGISANKNSQNLMWVLEFINFIFYDANIRAYAEEAAIIPNVQDALDVVAKQYNLDVATDVTLCGEILFSTSYNGYNPINKSFLPVCKCSAKKYMVNLNRDADGNIQYETDENGRFLYMGNEETKVYEQYVGEEDLATPGFAFCNIEYFMDNTEKEFAKYGAE